MNILRRIIRPSWHPWRAGAVGVAATVVYSIAMEGDMSITGNRFSDVRFIEGLIQGMPLPRQTLLPLSWILHFLNGVMLAEIYAAIFKRFLPGPRWLKGAVFSELFLTSAWVLTPLADKHHPMIKSGELPKLANWTSFLQNLVRHLAFGLTLGWLYRDS
jgi:hypothetical protein